MKVKHVRDLLANMDGELDFVVRTEDEDGNSFQGTPSSIAVEEGCDGEPFVAVDCIGDEDTQPMLYVVR